MLRMPMSYPSDEIMMLGIAHHDALMAVERVALATAAAATTTTTTPTTKDPDAHHDAITAVDRVVLAAVVAAA